MTDEIEIPESAFEVKAPRGPWCIRGGPPLPENGAPRSMKMGNTRTRRCYDADACCAL